MSQDKSGNNKTTTRTDPADRSRPDAAAPATTTPTATERAKTADYHADSVTRRHTTDKASTEPATPASQAGAPKPAAADASSAHAPVTPGQDKKRDDSAASPAGRSAASRTTAPAGPQAQPTSAQPAIDKQGGNKSADDKPVSATASALEPASAGANKSGLDKSAGSVSSRSGAPDASRTTAHDEHTTKPTARAGDSAVATAASSSKPGKDARKNKPSAFDENTRSTGRSTTAASAGKTSTSAGPSAAPSDTAGPRDAGTTGTTTPTPAAGGAERATPPGGGSGGGRRRRSFATLLAVLALLIALAALAGLGYLGYRGQQALTRVNDRIDSATQGMQGDIRHAVSERVTAIDQRLGQVSDTVTGLIQQTGQERQQIASLRQTIDTLRQQNTELQSALGGDHEAFVEQRILSLLEAANQRLTIFHDPKGAKQALQLADLAIRHGGLAQLHDVRAQIADEVAALDALPDTDIEGLALRLSKLTARVPNLSIASDIPSAYHANGQSGNDAADRPSADESDGWIGINWHDRWQRMTRSVSNTLSQMVTVRHVNGTSNAPALMAPDQTFFLYQNLQLELRMARLALMNHDDKAYHASLSEADDWLGRYFDTDDTAVQAMRSAIDKLGHVDLDWQAPDITASLTAMRRTMANDTSGRQSGNSNDSNGQNGQNGQAPQIDSGQAPDPAENDTDETPPSNDTKTPAAPDDNKGGTNTPPANPDDADKAANGNDDAASDALQGGA